MAPPPAQVLSIVWLSAIGVTGRPVSESYIRLIAEYAQRDIHIS